MEKQTNNKRSKDNRRHKRSEYIQTTTTALGITAETILPTRQNGNGVRVENLDLWDYTDKVAGQKFLQKHSRDNISKALNCIKYIADNSQRDKFNGEELKNALCKIDDNRHDRTAVYSKVCEVIMDMAQLMFCVPMKIIENGKAIHIRRTFQLFSIEKCDTEHKTGDKGLSVFFSPLIFKGEKTKLSDDENILPPRKTKVKLQYLKGSDSREKSFNGMLAITDHATETTILEKYLGYEQRRIYGGDLSHITRDRKSIPERFERAQKCGLVTEWSERRNGNVTTYYWKRTKPTKENV